MQPWWRAARAPDPHLHPFSRNSIEALKLLFTSDIGLLSLFTIVFVIGMGIWFRRFFTKQIEAEEARNPH